MKVEHNARHESSATPLASLADSSPASAILPAAGRPEPGERSFGTGYGSSSGYARTPVSRIHYGSSGRYV